MRWGLSHRSPIGLDVGNRRIKAAQVALGPAESALTATLLLDRLQPEETLTAPEALRLAEVLDRRGFSGRRAVVAVPSRVALTSLLNLPPRSSGAPLDDIARSEMAHAHRVQPEGIEVAFWELPAPARPTDQTQVMAAACPLDEAESIIDALETAGLDVLALDTQGWAVTRACRPIHTAESGIVAFLDIGWDAATVVFLHQGVVVYERGLSGSGIKALSNAIESEHGFAPEVIGYLLHRIGFELDLRGQGDDWKLFAKARGHLETHFEQMGQELALSISYAQHQYPDAAVQRLLLTGGGATIPGLATHLSMALEVRITPVSPADLLKCPDSLGPDSANPALTIATGLALYGHGGSS